MSDTKVDMAEVTQMLDAGWRVTIQRKECSYVCVAFHPNGDRCKATAQALRASFQSNDVFPEYESRMDWTDDHGLITDDFTPEQALTRLAYKVRGVIL